MAVETLTIPCLKDNYAYLMHDTETGRTALIDVPEADPIRSALKDRGWTLTDVLLTHHHWDHIDGLPPLLQGLDQRPQVWGAAADAHRLPPLDHALSPADQPTICGQAVHVLDVPGHTVGHVAYYLPMAGLLFSGDSLMVMGCGRLFEGTPAQMLASLSRMAALPEATLVCSGHEYTAGNIAFALSLEPDNQALILRSRAVRMARDAGRPTVPATLAEERATNPFLRAHNPALQSALGMSGAAVIDVFTEIRARKDKF